jgi:hypothetical protein
MPSPRDQTQDPKHPSPAPGTLTPTSADTLAPAISFETNGSQAIPGVAPVAADGTLMPPPSGLPDLNAEGAIGSPYKKQRASLPGIDSEVRRKLALDSVNGTGEPRRESESAVRTANALGSGQLDGVKFEPGPVLGTAVEGPVEMEDEEL